MAMVEPWANRSTPARSRASLSRPSRMPRTWFSGVVSALVAWRWPASSMATTSVKVPPMSTATRTAGPPARAAGRRARPSPRQALPLDDAGGQRDRRLGGRGADLDGLADDRAAPIAAMEDHVEPEGGALDERRVVAGAQVRRLLDIQADAVAEAVG